MIKNNKLFIIFLLIMPIFLILLTKYFVGVNKDAAILIAISISLFLPLCILCFSYNKWLNRYIVKFSDATLIISFLIALFMLSHLTVSAQLVLLYLLFYIISVIWYRDLKKIIKVRIPMINIDTNANSYVRTYKLSSFTFDILMVCWLPIVGVFLTYYSISRKLGIEITIIMLIFNIILLLPVVFILLKTKHKIITSATGISQQKLFKSIFIAWKDIDKIEYDTVISAFSRPRFSKPKDIVIYSNSGKVIYVMDTLEDFSDLRDFLESKEYLKLIDRNC